jgi:hypothetical protein
MQAMGQLSIMLTVLANCVPISSVSLDVDDRTAATGKLLIPDKFAVHTTQRSHTARPSRTISKVPTRWLAETLASDYPKRIVTAHLHDDALALRVHQGRQLAE